MVVTIVTATSTMVSELLPLDAVRLEVGLVLYFFRKFNSEETSPNISDSLGTIMDHNENTQRLMQPCSHHIMGAGHFGHKTLRHHKIGAEV